MSNYSFIFSQEEHFDPQQKREWMLQHRRDPFYYSAVYLCLIFTVKAYMKDRLRFELRRAAIVWNTVLAIFSIMTACRTIPELYDSLVNYGFAHSVCNNNFTADDKVTAFWCWMMVLSKLPELLDTLLVVFRKHQLIFLHWYHHITVLMYSWYCYSEHAGPLRWFACMNSFAHSCMYTYYTLRSVGIKVPKLAAMSITLIQIIQMVIGFYVCYYGYVTDTPCEFPGYLGICGMLIYGSYGILFVRFFFRSYFTADKKNKSE